jgi:threonine/homoserine/homoserine lactone efflux protein
MVPGPGAMMILRQLMSDGRHVALLTLAGNELSLILWGVASGAGFAVVIAASPTAFTTMQVLCAALLVLFGVHALWSARRLRAVLPGLTSSATRSSAFRAGVLANITNPKAAVFAMSFLPQFVPKGFPTFATEVGLAVVWAAVDACWFVAVIWVVGSNAMTLGRPTVRRGLTVCSGIVLIALGVRTFFG